MSKEVRQVRFVAIYHVTDKDKTRVLHYLNQKYILKDMTK